MIFKSFLFSRLSFSMRIINSVVVPTETAFFTLAFTFLKLSASILNSFCSIVIVIGSVISSFEISPGSSITVSSSFEKEILNKPDSKVLVPFSKTKPSFAVRTI